VIFCLRHEVGNIDGFCAVNTVLNTIPFGIGVAASTRVGNLLGLQSAVGAKRAAHASALLSVIVGAIVMIIMMASKDVGFYLSMNILCRFI
jgi:MATE family multidrug resistance protein